MNGRLIVLQHPDQQQRDTWARRLGGGWQAVDGSGVSLLSRGAAVRESFDGRAIGCRTGVLFNVLDQRATLITRGVPSARLDGDGICVEVLGAGGPGGLSDLARHGLVAVLHRALGGVLVASDAQGIAPLYVLRPPEGGCMVASDRAALRLASGLSLARDDADRLTLLGPGTGAPGLWRTPPGRALLLDARGLQVHGWRPERAAAPFLRHRPTALTSGDIGQSRAALENSLHEAVAAWQLDRGPLPHPTGATLPGLPGLPFDAAPLDATETGRAALWPTDGWSRLRAEFSCRKRVHPSAWMTAADLIAAHAAAHRGSPFAVAALPEPEAKLSRDRRAARWSRYTEWRCGALERQLDAAAAIDQAVALPHLAPTVVAALGALPDGGWPWLTEAP